MFCKYCGNSLADDAHFCPNCGKQISDLEHLQQPQPQSAISEISPKSRIIAALLAFFIGFGTQRFYVGKWKSGILYLISGILLGMRFWSKFDFNEDEGYIFCLPNAILSLIDFIAILAGKFKDKNERQLKKWSFKKAENQENPLRTMQKTIRKNLFSQVFKSHTTSERQEILKAGITPPPCIPKAV